MWDETTGVRSGPVDTNHATPSWSLWVDDDRKDGYSQGKHRKDSIVNTVTNAFEDFTVYYGTVSDRDAPNREYVRIECFHYGKKTGQILLGNSVNPGNYASVNNGEIDLYYPLANFSNIYQLLQGASKGELSLYVDFDPAGEPLIGGVRRLG